MAKLVRVYRNSEEENKLENHQILLSIDDGLKVILEFPVNFLSIDPDHNLKGFQAFMKRYQNLMDDELAMSFMVTQNEVLSFLSKTVPCVGCRQSVEKLYTHILKTSQPALKPLVMMQSGVLTIDPSFLKDPCLLHTFLYCRGSKLNEILEGIPKCRRNRRCLLHSLETHKSRTPIGCWLDVWESLSHKCRDEIVTINSDTLLDALENHLRKNKFCTDCKRKVLKAFGILTGDIQADKVKGYCASLYSGLKPCPMHKHIHVPNDVGFLTDLLEKAEHELSGMRRERHAKTMDTAQEEVLTCLAVFMWERLHHLWQKLRIEEQTWQLLFYVGINTLRRNFEVSMEEKQGVSMLEQLVEEISEQEKDREVRREQKRLKKRARRKEKCKHHETPALCHPPKALTEPRNNEPAIEVGRTCSQKNGVIVGEESQCFGSDEIRCVDNSKYCDEQLADDEYCCDGDETLRNGKCLECSLPDGFKGDGGKWPDLVDSACSSCNVHADADEWLYVDGDDRHHDVPVDDEEKQLLLSMGWNCDHLCQDDSLNETDLMISKEEIMQYKANRKQLFNERQQLREKLREKFNSLSIGAHASR